MEELSGWNRLVGQPKITIKEQKEVIMIDGQTPIQKRPSNDETFRPSSLGGTEQKLVNHPLLRFIFIRK